MKRRLFTAFHPQTDGATECQNQILEIFLRSYINYQQNNWAKLFAPTQYKFNDNINRIIEKISFNIIYRFKFKFRINPVAADSDISKKIFVAR
jgi:hypothetical protein